MNKLVFSLLFAAACVQPADPKSDSKPEMPLTTDAQSALADNADLFHHILESKGEDPTQALTPGRPLPVIAVHASELASFDATRELAPLFHTTRERWFPLFGHAGTPLGSITLQSSNGRWVMTRAGSPTLTRALVAARAALPSDTDEVGLVRIAELGVDFLAVNHGDELALVPLYDNDKLELHARTIQPAVAVMAQLAPSAARLH
jgi:hypothetical protein